MNFLKAAPAGKGGGGGRGGSPTHTQMSMSHTNFKHNYLNPGPTPLPHPPDKKVFRDPRNFLETDPTGRNGGEGGGRVSDIDTHTQIFSKSNQKIKYTDLNPRDIPLSTTPKIFFRDPKH